MSVEMERAFFALTKRVERLEQRVDAFAAGSRRGPRQAQPATPSDEERAAWVERVLQLADRYAGEVDEASLRPRSERGDAIVRAHKALRAAVEKLAHGRDPRST